MSAAAHAHESHGHHDDHGHDHHEQSFWSKYVFLDRSQDGSASSTPSPPPLPALRVLPDALHALEHRLPGPRARRLGLVFIEFLGGGGATAGSTRARSPASLYNMFGAMHGTIMVFLGVVPLGFAAFGNYVTPLQIGAIDMAFPRLNMGVTGASPSAA
jgi:cytochrome c oxidase subunit I